MATLGASSYTYVEATAAEDLRSFIGAHCRAFEFFGGVPEVIVPDNTKTGVTRPCYYEPDLNPTYLDMAEHYGMVVIPTRVRSPRDKAKVESAVGVVETRILAPPQKPDLLQPGRTQPGDLGAAHPAQPKAVPEARGEPALALRGA